MKTDETDDFSRGLAVHEDWCLMGPGVIKWFPDTLVKETSFVGRITDGPRTSPECLALNRTVG